MADDTDKELFDLLKEVDKISSGDPVPEPEPEPEPKELESKSAEDLLNEMAGVPKLTEKEQEQEPESKVDSKPEPNFDPKPDTSPEPSSEVIDPEVEVLHESSNNSSLDSLNGILDKKDEDPRLAKIKDGLMGLLESVVENSKTQLAEFTEDRQNVDRSLAVLITRLESGTDMSGAQLTALAMLTQTRADVSANRSKYIDSVAKLFASLKKNDTIIMPSNSDSSLSQNEMMLILKNAKQSE